MAMTRTLETGHFATKRFLSGLTFRKCLIVAPLRAVLKSEHEKMSVQLTQFS